MNTAITAAKEKVDAAFESFIGNTEAVYALKRSVIVALALADGKPAALSRVFLLSGPPSSGKTEIARRITTILGVPFIRLDGRAVKSRERMFEMIDDALAADDLAAKHSGRRANIPIIDYPAFSVFIDEVHLVGEKTQEAFLTLLEADDRMIMLDGEKGRRIAAVNKSAFIFATTKPVLLDRAFRSRCIEISLRRYTVAEVQIMVHARFPHLPESAVETIASCARGSPRQAFMLAQEVEEEILCDPEGNTRECVKRVLNGRGILFRNGITRDDMRYMEILQRERRPVGEAVMASSLYDIEQQHMTDDIEPYLLSLGYTTITSKGRSMTARGLEFLRQAKEEQA